MAFYTLLTYFFPSISLNKHAIEVEFSETLFIPELADLGEFTYSKFDQALQNEMVLPFWSKYIIDGEHGNAEIELSFDSDDKKINEQQLEGYKSIVQYSAQDWENILNEILAYYMKHYSDLEDWDLHIETIEGLSTAIQLNSISIQKSGRVGMSFDCIWDEEHGLGVRIEKSKEVTVGQATYAYH